MKNANIYKYRITLTLAFCLGLLASACEREPRVSALRDAGTIEQRYGLTSAYSERISTDDGSMDATIVPVTLSDGRTAQLVIPKRPTDGYRVFLRDSGGLAPVVLENPRVSRDEFVRTQPRVVERRVVTPVKKKRSWQKEALIIGGGAGAGAAIGALAGGGKGAGIGAATGGVAGLIYDLATRNK
jgi:hypothetical protein